MNCLSLLPHSAGSGAVISLLAVYKDHKRTAVSDTDVHFRNISRSGGVCLATIPKSPDRESGSARGETRPKTMLSLKKAKGDP